MRTLRLVWRLARFRFGLYLLSGSLDSTLLYVIPLVPGLLVRQFFDALTGPAPAASNPATWLALLVAYAVAAYGASVVGGVVETCAGQIAGALLRTNALREVLRQPGSRALPASTGEAISRLRNDVDYVEFFLTWTLDPLGQALVLAVALFVLARLDPLITLAVVLPVVAVVAATRVAARRLQQYRRSSQEAIGEVTGLLGDAFGGVVAVKAAGAEASVVDYLRALGEARRQAAVSDQVFSQLVGALSTNAASLGTGVLLLVAASAMRNGSFTVGDFALVVSYLGTLAVTTSNVGEFISKHRQTEVSLDRLAALLQGAPPEALVRRGPVFPDELPPPPARPSRDAEPFARLDARGLSYRYPDSERGIEDVALHLERGTLTVVTGRVGAGKTTLLRVLLGLLPSDAGEVAWNGRPVRDLATFMVPPRVAYTPQVPRLFSETLRENVLLGFPADEPALTRALGLAVLDLDLARLENGLDTLVGPRGTRLSGGQVQRAAAARMLVRDAELLVVDDLSSALDVDTEQALWDGLLAPPARAFLAVSHRRALLRRADRILVLEDGRLVGAGRLDELLETCEALRQIWRREPS